MVFLKTFSKDFDRFIAFREEYIALPFHFSISEISVDKFALFCSDKPYRPKQCRPKFSTV